MEQLYMNPEYPFIVDNQLGFTDERQPYYPYHRPRSYYPYYPHHHYPHYPHYPYYPQPYPWYGHGGGNHHY